MQFNSYERLRDSVFGSFSVFDKLIASKAGYTELELSNLAEEVILNCFFCLSSDLKKKKFLDKVKRILEQPYMTVDLGTDKDHPYVNQRNYKSNSVSVS
jgi:hypothetical protein